MAKLFKSLTVGSQLTCLFLIACLSVTSGCGGYVQPVETKYGKVNEQPRSINSTSLFAARLEELGYDVTIRNRISPKINEFNTVFWFPENVRCPSDEATQAIEEWMDKGYRPRTLVYVGADYRADEDYYRAAQKQVAPKLKAESQRLLSEAQLATQNRRNSWQANASWPDWSNTKCDWFDIEVIKPPKHSNLLARPMADNAILSVAPELPVEVMMSPKQSAAKWEVESLLSVDGEDMVYRLSDNNSSQIIVVQNGSFLVNLAAAYPNKQALADQLVAEATSLNEDDYGYGYGYGFSQQILILESEYEIPIRNTDFVNQNLWAWIAEEPLCYIVPHALLWGVLFCFVYFPIFGRPKRLPKQSTTSFGNHINAIAKQLSKSSSKEHARRTVEQYQESVSGSNKKNS